MQARLTWPQARALSDAGARVRRADWDDRYIFRTAGGLHWLSDYAQTYSRVVCGADFQRSEFLAGDWTDADPDQNHCVGIDFSNYTAGEVLTIAGNDNQVSVRDFSYNTRKTPWEITPALIVNPVNFEQEITLSWEVEDQAYANIPRGSYQFTIYQGPFTSTPLQKQMLYYLFPPDAPGLRIENIAVAGKITARWKVPKPPPSTDQYSPRTVINTFAAPISVLLTGSVFDQLLLNDSVIRSGAGGAFDPVRFTLAAGGSFTIAARSQRRDFPFYIGYDIAATFTV